MAGLKTDCGHLPVGSRVEFRRSYAGGGEGPILGVAAHCADGWWFHPPVLSRRHGSRKGHPTLERCLPRWVFYPDGCTSRLLPASLPAEGR